MCIAIVKPRGVSLAEDRLRICFENNPDGAGFAIATDQGVAIHKGYTTFKAFWTAYREYQVDEHTALVHFRITTRGENSACNHHPFPVVAGALVHNGTIGWLGKPGQGPSDTALFADLLQDMTVVQWRRLRPLIEHSTGWSRFALLTHEGEVLLFNTAEWEEADGALYSNDTYLPEPGITAGASLYGQDPFRWESDLTLTRLRADGTVYRDEDLERDVLQEWMACYGEPPMEAWAWAVLDDITHDYIEEERYELEQLHAA
jgi:hypothetical protein